MKFTIKSFLLCFSFMLVSMQMFAEEKECTTTEFVKREKKDKEFSLEGGASAKNNFVIQPTLNIGHHLGFAELNYAGNRYGNGLLLGMTLNLDYNVHDYISIGVYYGVAFKNYKDNNVAYLGQAVGARGAFHWWQLIDDKSDKDLFSEKLDFDFHAHLGAYILSYKDKALDSKTKKYGLNAGGGIGLRYYFVDHFGVAIEAGYEEASWGKIGFAIKI